MDQKSNKLTQLRNRAEAMLKQTAETPTRENLDPSEVIHELNVYHVELEMQLEELLQANQALEAAQQRYAQLFDFAPIGYIVTDINGIVMDANLTISAMLNINRHQLENTAFANFITTDFQNGYHLHRRTTLRTRQPQTCEVQIQRHDGTLFYAQLNTEVSIAESQTLRTAVTNITGMKETEESLHRTLAHEQKINQLGARILTVIAHEFRTPLATLLTSIDILDRYGDKLTEDKKVTRYQAMRGIVWYLNDIVQNASSLANDNDPFPIQPAMIYIIPFTRQIIDDLKVTTKEGQTITLVVNGQQDQAWIAWDERLFRRVLVNLLSNAIIYSEGEINVQLDCDSDMIQIRIADHGMGIPDDDQPHIYDAFYRGKNVEFIHGTGIGLYIAQQAILAHGGTINCESQLGVGTTFTLALPRQPAITPL